MKEETIKHGQVAELCFSYLFPKEAQGSMMLKSSVKFNSTLVPSYIALEVPLYPQDSGHLTMPPSQRAYSSSSPCHEKHQNHIKHH